MTVLSLSFALLITLSIPAHASSACDGLSVFAPQTLFQESELLTNVDQLPNQYVVTGCSSRALFQSRPACLRPDVHGSMNGQFGSCATYSAFSAAIAITKKLNINLSPAYQYTSENLVRLYDLYGNALDTLNPGNGSFHFVLGKIIQEMATHLSLTPEQRSALKSQAALYHYSEIAATERGNLEAPTTQALIEKLAQHFNHDQSTQVLPAQVTFDGWVLDRNPNQYCPIRDASGKCNALTGQDQREAHSALIVGRQILGGECYVEIRNSWSSCRHGHYGRSENRCFENNDFVWVKEKNFFTAVSAIRTL